VVIIASSRQGLPREGSRTKRKSVDAYLQYHRSSAY